MDDVPGFVAHDLGLDVPRFENQLLDEDAAVAESFLSLGSVGEIKSCSAHTACLSSCCLQTMAHHGIGQNQQF